MKKFLYFLLLSLVYLLLSGTALAADFKSDYQIEYFLSERNNKLDTRVKFTVAITNFRTDVFVKQLSIGFPETFAIKNIRASDDNGLIKPVIENSDSLTKISLDFSNPSIGKNSQGNFYLEFDQENLFIVNGNVWEVIIPTVQNKKDGNYTIRVHLPNNSNKKISISKPKPSNVNGDTITWTNPTTKTIYAVFGETQFYQTDLTYHLKNEKLIPVYTDVAFPPDTLYQKVIVEAIEPQPATVHTDEDGNYLGRFFLKPRETKTIQFKGFVTVFSKAREEILPEIRRTFALQRKYLLADNKYWRLSNQEIMSSLRPDIKNIYDFTIRTLSYNYKKIETENARLGADAVLKNPANAVCMEFTDLFVAAARANKIYAREIEGYGFSQDPKLRPISLVSDILHSWPEYYDLQSQLWLQADPTWEDTSGIDYFGSFDLNHITFVIHGKDPEYPFPAGTYKINDSRDVTITASNKTPKAIESLAIKHKPFPVRINDNKSYPAKLTLTNTGNVFLWLKPAELKASNIQLAQTSPDIIVLAPRESKAVDFTYRSQEKNRKTQGNINIKFAYSAAVSADFSIVPFYYEMALLTALALAFCAGLVFLILLIRKAKK